MDGKATSMSLRTSRIFDIGHVGEPGGDLQ
jgi:hypothetical protein